MSLSVLEVVSQEDLKVRIETQKRQQTQMCLKGNVLSRLDQAFDAVYELFEEHGDSFLPGAKQKITSALNAAEQALNEVTSEPDDANSSVKRKHHEAAVEWDSDDDEGHATGANEGHATGAASEDSNAE